MMLLPFLILSSIFYLLDYLYEKNKERFMYVFMSLSIFFSIVLLLLSIVQQ